MSLAALIHRSRMGKNAPAVDPYEGWKFGYRFNSVGETAHANSVITCAYSVNAGDSIRCFTTIDGTNRAAFAFTDGSNGATLGWLNGAFTIPAGKNQIKVSLNSNALDTSYILNETTGKYLYKGKNV